MDNRAWLFTQACVIANKMNYPGGEAKDKLKFVNSFIDSELLDCFVAMAFALTAR
ncbi:MULTISPECIES: hypothetical protein [Legionella]|uniref:hypothetical protein n=1 Tax=Legionella TaxID=445 RepID=UPI000AA35DA1|nr:MULTISPECIES: hypothetical protein [Legionella]